MTVDADRTLEIGIADCVLSFAQSLLDCTALFLLGRKGDTDRTINSVLGKKLGQNANDLNANSLAWASGSYS